MKILIISDSHGNIANLKHVLEFGKRINVEAVIHCGDWNSLKAVKLVKSYKIPVYGVLGNADIDDRLTNIFKQIEKIEIDNKKILIIHNIKKLEARMQNLDIIFCGHTHKQGQNKNVVNPGALESSVNFAIYDTISGRVEFIHND